MLKRCAMKWQGITNRGVRLVDMLSRTAVVVRRASRSTFKLPPFKFRHSQLTSLQNESVPVITSPVSEYEQKTQEPDRDRKRREGERVHGKQKSFKQPKERYKSNLLMSEDSNTSRSAVESLKQPKTRYENSLLMSEDSDTSTSNRRPFKQPQTRYEDSLFMSEDSDTRTSNRRSFRQPKTSYEDSLSMSEDSDTSSRRSFKQLQTGYEKRPFTFGNSSTGENDTKSFIKAREVSTGSKYTTKTKTKFTTKSPSQSVEDTLAGMGISIKGEIIFGIFPVLLALQAKRRTIHQLIYKSGSGNVSNKIQNILTIAKEQGVTVTNLKPSQFKLIFQGDQVHQGVFCDASLLPFITINEDNPEQQGGDDHWRYQAEEERKQQGEQEHEKSQAGKKNQGESSQMSWQTEWDGEDGRERRHAERENQSEGKQQSKQAEEKKHQQVEGKQTSQAARKTQESDNFIHQADKRNQQESHQAGRERKKLWLYLDQIHDPMNFGTVLRSAYFMGVDRVLTSETSSTRITSTVSKASAGAAEVFPVHQVKDPVKLATSLTRAGWEVVSSASPSNSGDGGGDDEACHHLTDITIFRPKGNVLLIVGNEGKGISPELQQMCQTVLTITPGRSLHPQLQCLNVSVATALLLHGLCQRLSPCRP